MLRPGFDSPHPFVKGKCDNCQKIKVGIQVCGICYDEKCKTSIKKVLVCKDCREKDVTVEEIDDLLSLL